MQRTILACLALAGGILAAAPVRAGDWQWGCMGPMGDQPGDQQILFSRNSLIIAPAKPPLGKLEDLFKIDDLAEKFPDADAAYNADSTADGLQHKMSYTNQSDPKDKLTLTEKSSKTISHSHHMVCGRDEDISMDRKTYRVERTDDATRDVRLVCREYLLTSRGGRPCISN